MSAGWCSPVSRRCRRCPGDVRPVLLLPGLVMLFVVMATANHYLIDGIVGAAVALGGLAAADQLPSPEWGRVQRILIGPDALIALGGVVDLMSGQAAGAYHRAVERPVDTESRTRGSAHPHVNVAPRSHERHRRARG